MDEELDAPRPQLVHGGADVGGRERQVLHAGAAVELQVLVDLRLALADGGLVQRELHPVVAARDHLAHQRRVLGGDVVADELGHVGEAHDPVVEAPPTRPCRPSSTLPTTWSSAMKARLPAARTALAARRRTRAGTGPR